MKLRIYLDTSIFSAYYDQRAPDRRAQTEDFWGRVAAFEACSSELAKEELAQTPDADRRKKLLEMLESVTLHRITAEIREVAGPYVKAGVFTPIMVNDAVHVAAAVLTRQDILLSWNFKHLVNRVRRAKVNEVNVSLGLPTIEIIAPPEI
ncbi:MAG: type II toxin-antitoxin system VapC family toxin [Deltaproteobacteria bacterium]|nr:MAG: type II toxin-antitoxin system VapC family toxin [Deltaproteobacteria bacterium]